jgi:hypothetical protein
LLRHAQRRLEVMIRRMHRKFSNVHDRTICHELERPERTRPPRQTEARG